jgi:hypothetical protein
MAADEDVVPEAPEPTGDLNDAVDADGETESAAD